MKLPAAFRQPPSASCGYSFRKSQKLYKSLTKKGEFFAIILPIHAQASLSIRQASSCHRASLVQATSLWRQFLRCREASNHEVNESILEADSPAISMLAST